MFGKPTKIALLGATAALALSPAADAATKKPQPLKLSWVRCFSVKDTSCSSERTVTAGGALKLAVVAGPKARVVLRDTKGGKRKVRPWWRTKTRMWVRVPDWAASGSIVVVEGARRSNPMPVQVRENLGDAAKAFAGDGMWIWQLSQVEGGNVAALIARAKANGVDAVYVKGADATKPFSQLTPALVGQLKAAGLRVCAWQYVYGSNPAGEAAAAAQNIRTGVDCFIIDAETEYEGRYAQAQTYMTALRAAVGPDFPIALSSFPYVDYHPTFPYSVFLATGNAQANLPQMYWKAIGTTPDTNFDKTYASNQPYARPIFPTGQLYEAPAAADVQRFRALAQGYGAQGVNWWSWQHASSADWSAALGQPGPAPAAVTPTWIALSKGSRGDLVVRVQELLRGGGAALEASGNFGPLTDAAIRGLQAKRGLPVTGVVDEATWRELLTFTPEPTDWSGADAPKAGRRTATAD
jgi:Putative peptidoglycan binding domain